MTHRLYQFSLILVLLYCFSPEYALSSEGKMPHKYYLELLEKAEAGDAKLQDFFGTIYMYGNDIIEGITVQQDADKALYWLTLAANNGYPKSMFRLHLIYRNDDFGVEQDLDKSLKWGFEAVKHNFPIAQYSLATMYLKGEGVPQNNQKAALYMGKAAAQQYPPALSDLGEFYFHGVGVQQSFEKALEFYVEAAKKGKPIALQRLSQMYFEGLGVAVDRKEAYKWIVIAALTGDEESIALKKQFDSQLSPVLIQKGKDWATEWLKIHDRYREIFPK